MSFAARDAKPYAAGLLLDWVGTAAPLKKKAPGTQTTTTRCPHL